MKPTYQQQFDKLTEAYIKNEIEPTDSCACFVGNLLNNTREWARKRRIFGEENNVFATFTPEDPQELDPEYGFYTMSEICDLERCFMTHPTYEEEGLFNAFSKSLDLLKKIHEEKGEIIDISPVFVKRQLVKS